jgi:5'-3' exonuclease
MEIITTIKDKDCLYFDLSYCIFYRFFACLSWYKRQNEEIDIDEIINNKIFMSKYEEMFIRCINNLILKYDIAVENVYLVRDCSREHIWRNEFATNYKGTRDENRGSLNKNIFAHTYQNIIPKLEGIQTICMDTMEADDIIAIMSKYIRSNSDGKQYIITNDNDYIQLCVDENIIVINLQGLEIKSRVPYDPVTYLKIKIILGDKSDNICSIAKNVGIKTSEKLALSDEVLNAFFEKKPEAKVQYELNKLLIDFNKIPENLICNITNIIKFKENLTSI